MDPLPLEMPCQNHSFFVGIEKIRCGHVYPFQPTIVILVGAVAASAISRHR